MMSKKVNNKMGACANGTCLIPFSLHENDMQRRGSTNDLFEKISIELSEN